MVIEHLKIALRNIKRRKLRTFLTLIGILIGTMAVVALFSVGDGVKASIEEEFKEMGMDKIMIMPGSGNIMSMMTSTSSLDDEDVDIISKVSGVEAAVKMLTLHERVSVDSESKIQFVSGIPQNEDGKEIIESMQNFNIKEGKDLKEGDKRKAVVGCLYAKDDEIFSDKLNVRDKIMISGKEFEVIGFLECIGNPSDDSSIIVTLDSAENILGGEGAITIIAQVGESEDPEKVADEIERKLRKRRGIEKGQEDYSVQTSADLLRTFNRTFSLIQAVIIGIAAISLLVGGIGIINTMYTAVLERKSEIGIMKATGARNSDITLIFLFESGMLGLIGGLIGVGLGIAMGKLIEYLAVTLASVDFLQVHFSPIVIIGMLVFSLGLGALFGVWPARIAAKMSAVDAIRKK